MRPTVIVAFLASLPLSAQAEIIHVPGDYLTIQWAVDAAVNGDEVVVAAGTYEENVLIVGKAITVRSESGPMATALDWEDRAGFLIDDLEMGTVTIEGFTIQSARAYAIQLRGDGDEGQIRVIGNRLVDNGPDFGSVGVFSGSSHEIIGNVFIGNTSGAGSAIRIWASARIEDNIFTDNIATNGGGAVLVYGGPGPNPVVEIRNNRFVGNESDGSGGAISVSAGMVTIVENTFIGNHSTDFGGAILIGRTSGHRIEDNLFVGNSSGIGVEIAQVTIRGNTIVDTGPGHGISFFYLDPGGSVIEQNVVTGGSGAGIVVDDVETIVQCNVLFENAGGDLVGEGTFADNVFADPLFCDPGNGEYGVHSDSPCLPEGNPCGVLIGAFGKACGGSVPTIASSWGTVKAHFR